MFPSHDQEGKREWSDFTIVNDGHYYWNVRHKYEEPYMFLESVNLTTGETFQTVTESNYERHLGTFMNKDKYFVDYVIFRSSVDNSTWYKFIGNGEFSTQNRR